MSFETLPLNFLLLSAKMSWADVKQEMVGEKGLDEACADKIGKYVCLQGEFVFRCLFLFFLFVFVFLFVCFFGFFFCLLSFGLLFIDLFIYLLF